MLPGAAGSGGARHKNKMIAAPHSAASPDSDALRAESDKIAGDRHRHPGRRGAKVERDLRDRGQIHVDRERADGAQRAQDQNDQ